MPLRIVLAEDRASSREALTALMKCRGFMVAGAAADGRGAVGLCAQLQPEVAVLDFDIPSMNGPAVAAEIQRVAPDTSTVALSVRRGQARVVEALRAGVRGYVLKTSAVGDLLDAIQEVSGGRIYLSPRISGRLLTAFLSKPELPADPL